MIDVGVIAPKGGPGKTTITKSLHDTLIILGRSAQMIDLDPQKTLTLVLKLASITGVTQPSEASAQYLIYDTPPYHDDNTRAFIKKLNRIIIPVKGGYADLFALSSVYNDLKITRSLDKAVVVFNEVRKPIDATHKEIKRLIEKNYVGLEIAKTALSNLRDFKEVLTKPLQGKALAQMKLLVKEINL